MSHSMEFDPRTTQSIGARRQQAMRVDATGQRIANRLHAYEKRDRAWVATAGAMLCGGLVALESNHSLVAIGFGGLAAAAYISKLCANSGVEQYRKQRHEAAITAHHVHQIAELSDPAWVVQDLRDYEILPVQASAQIAPPNNG